jgi:hypothetical protein
MSAERFYLRRATATSSALPSSGPHEVLWNEVDKVVPDFRERKEWLRKNGAGLDV